MSYLQRLGATIGPILKVSSIADIIKILPLDGSVVMIAVKIMSGNIERGRHAIYVFRDSLGRLRFFDRTVGTNFGASRTQGVFHTMDDIAPLHSATNIVAYEASALKNVYIKPAAFELPRLVIPVLGVLSSEEQ
jgi:hypothetical protein